MGVFIKQNVYWIEYYVNRKRKRERIGSDKKLAETVFRKRKVEIAEGKFLDKPQPIITIFNELASAYLIYSRNNKRSWDRDETSIKHLIAYFNNRRLIDITPASIERYKTHRLASRTIYHRPPTPATINRELACLKQMFNIGRKGLIDLKGGIPSDNPVSAVKFLDEQNIRDRVLTRDEFDRMLDASPDYLKPILICAFHTSMRKGEILALTWDRLDLTNGFIRLKQVDTKTGERRHIPIGKELRMVLQGLPRNVSHQRVFTRNGLLIKSIREVFTRVCRDAGLTDVVFHDLRHTATTNLRRAGVDALTAMKITGHKTTAVFSRYNSIDDDDLTVAQERMDTYMDTTHRRGQGGEP